MNHDQQSQPQQPQWQGDERRRSQSQYQGDDRRQPLQQPEMPQEPGAAPSDCGAQNDRAKDNDVH